MTFQVKMMQSMITNQYYSVR